MGERRSKHAINAMLLQPRKRCFVLWTLVSEGKGDYRTSAHHTVEPTPTQMEANSKMNGSVQCHFLILPAIYHNCDMVQQQRRRYHRGLAIHVDQVIRAVVGFGDTTTLPVPQP